jgi:hypothetical protein
MSNNNIYDPEIAITEPEPEQIDRGIFRRAKYNPTLCENLVRHMEAGLSFASFSGAIGCSPTTLYTWCEKYPEFKAAREQAEAACLLYWEQQLLLGATGITKANATLMTFKLKNSFADQYQDKTTVDHLNAAPTQIVFNTGIARGDEKLLAPEIKTIESTVIEEQESENLAILSESDADFL